MCGVRIIGKASRVTGSALGRRQRPAQQYSRAAVGGATVASQWPSATVAQDYPATVAPNSVSLRARTSRAA
eukprot:5032094-Prymnesium_polylepis.1